MDKGFNWDAYNFQIIYWAPERDTEYEEYLNSGVEYNQVYICFVCCYKSISDMMFWFPARPEGIRL